MVSRRGQGQAEIQRTHGRRRCLRGGVQGQVRRHVGEALCWSGKDRAETSAVRCGLVFVFDFCASPVALFCDLHSLDDTPKLYTKLDYFGLILAQ